MWIKFGLEAKLIRSVGFFCFVAMRDLGVFVIASIRFALIKHQDQFRCLFVFESNVFLASVRGNTFPSELVGNDALGVTPLWRLPLSLRCRAKGDGARVVGRIIFIVFFELQL